MVRPAGEQVRRPRHVGSLAISVASSVVPPPEPGVCASFRRVVRSGAFNNAFLQRSHGMNVAEAGY